MQNDETPPANPVHDLVHTPGPWVVKRRFDVYKDTQTPGVGGTFVASTKGNHPLPEHINKVCEADARLIAAAPELLSALKEILEWIASGYDPSIYDIEEAARVVQKAETGV